VLDQARSRRYAFVLTGDEIPLPEGVNKIAVSGNTLLDILGG
jgi:hypothetical protein